MRLYTAKAKPLLITWVKSGRKVGERSTKPSGFTKPHYFDIYNISLYDFTTIQTARAEIYLFTIGTPYKIYSRLLVFASLGGGNLTVKCPSPETLRQATGGIWGDAYIPSNPCGRTEVWGDTREAFRKGRDIIYLARQWGGRERGAAGCLRRGTFEW